MWATVPTLNVASANPGTAAITSLATVPLGARARLDAYNGRLEILEPGVR